MLIELTKCGYQQNCNEDKEMVVATICIHFSSNDAECMALVLQDSIIPVAATGNSCFLERRRPHVPNATCSTC
jgi:hypothetical protein